VRPAYSPQSRSRPSQP